MRYRVIAALFLWACSAAPSDETPAGVVRLFLSAMERAERDPAGLEQAYRLCSASTQRALQQRAHFAVQVGGHPMQPWEIFARSRYRQVFTPASGRRGMRTRIDGDRATVTVSTASGRRSAEVPLVREHGGWRLIIELPPAREREGAGEPTSAE